jgi:hypothetical protein
VSSVSFPFRGWWVPGRAVRAAWASASFCAAVGARPCRLPSRVPVWVLWRFGGGGGPRSWLCVGPRGRFFVAVSSSVSVASGLRGPRGVRAWSAAWRRVGGVPGSSWLPSVPARVRAAWVRR